MAPPVLRDVPMLRRFFTNVGYGREQREVFLLVTPRVIVNAESDE
jgi:type II secretory pathway component GspD/PulD (secretin)